MGEKKYTQTELDAEIRQGRIAQIEYIIQTLQEEIEFLQEGEGQ